MLQSIRMDDLALGFKYISAELDEEFGEEASEEVGLPSQLKRKSSEGMASKRKANLGKKSGSGGGDGSGSMVVKRAHRKLLAGKGQVTRLEESYIGESASCGVHSYDVKAVPAGKVVIIGTKENIETRIPLDFTGIWWMRGNKVPEVLVSFAGMTSSTTSEPWFPTTLNIPNSRKHMWAWDESTKAGFIQAYYAFGMDHGSRMNIRFFSSTEGEVETALKDVWPILVKKWSITKANEDEWIRGTYFKKESIFAGRDQDYTLTRIVYEGGQKTKHWPDFEKWMETGRLSVFDSDDRCRRLCVLGTQDVVAHLGNCTYCKSCCDDTDNCPFHQLPKGR